MTIIKHFGYHPLAFLLSLGMFVQQAQAQQDQQEEGQQVENIASQFSESDLSEPVIQVAHEKKSKNTPQLAARVTPQKKPLCPFNLTKRPDEHPLRPALRMAEECLTHIDKEIADYSAVLIKQERINGQLGEEQAAFVKVRHQPFAVYMFFLKPCKGREVLYKDATDGTKGILVAMDCGWKRRFGKLEFDPEGNMAMNGQKYPVMKLGIRELTKELIDVANTDVNFSECEVSHSQRVMNGRSVTMLEVVHPTPRKNFRFYKAQIFMDNELRVPIRYAAYLWPENPGEKPPLEEVYTYLKLKTNNGFTDKDFDRENPEIFKD
jgi:hypothetical protein